MRPFNALRNWWGQSLRRRLLAATLIAALPFLALLGYLAYRLGQAGMQDEVNRRNRQLVALAAQEVNAQFYMVRDNARLLAYQLETAALLPLQARVMLELRRTAPLTFRALYLFDGEGRLLIHLTDSVDDLLAIRDVEQIVARPAIPLPEKVSTARQAAQGEGLFLSPTAIVGADQVPVAYMGFPILDRQGQSGQIIVAEMDLRSVWRRVDGLRIGQTGRAFVVSHEGIIIAHPERVYIGRSLAPELRPVLAGYEGQAEYADPLSGHRMMAAFSPVGKESGWGVVVEQERDEALAPIQRIAYATFGVLLAALGVATLVSILIAQSITRPIQHLVEATRRITRTGDLDQDVVVEGQDEVGQLAATFNQMLTSLRQARQEILELNAGLETRVAERTAELSAANQELEAFAYSVSHDLRAPLRGIDGWSHVLLEDYYPQLDDTARQYLDRVRAEAQRMGQLIDDLLQLSRVTRAGMNKRRVNLTTLAHATVARLQAAQPERRVEIVIQPDLTAHGDPTLLEVVLTNLLDNAFKFTGGRDPARIEFGRIPTPLPKGEGTLGLLPSPPGRGAGGEGVVYFVRDNGAGFDMAYAQKLFGAFQRMHKVSEFPGTGIGLATVQRVIRRHGGRVWAEAQVDQGATFYFTLEESV